MFQNTSRILIYFGVAISAVATALGETPPPVASYVFPAGGRRGENVVVKVGGLNFAKSTSFEVLGDGVKADSKLKRVPTTWFEGPVIPLPDSQQAEDYPKDHEVRVEIAKDARLGVRYWRAWTGQGATTAAPFEIGNLPEIVEQEVDGDPIPTPLNLPVTVNGRIFPREDVDIWTFEAKANERFTCEVKSSRLGYPLDARLEILGPNGRSVIEDDDSFGADPFIGFTAIEAGRYSIKIHDVSYGGLQTYIYRLTVRRGPDASDLRPLGGRRGETIRLSASDRSWPSEGVPVRIAEEGRGAEARIVEAAVPVGDVTPVLLDVDDLPERSESPNAVVTIPAVLNGRIEKPGEVDEWLLDLKKNAVTNLDLRAYRLGSKLDAIIRVLDPNGKEVASASATAKKRDPSLSIRPTADGVHKVRVASLFPTGGGSHRGYRLRVTPEGPPDFSLSLKSDILAIERGKIGKIEVSVVRSGGFDGPVTLIAEGLPKGVSIGKDREIPAKKNSAALEFVADPNAGGASGRVVLKGVAKIGSGIVERIASHVPFEGAVPIDSTRMVVTIPTPFKITADHDFRYAPRGSTYWRKFKIDRNGFEGPIEVRLGDRQARHLQGVAGPSVTVPAKVSDFEFKVDMPPWMEVGRTSRAVILASGMIKGENGDEFEVFDTSQIQQMQIVAVVEPGKLGLELGRASAAAVAGGYVEIAAKIRRGPGIEGPVTLELVAPEHYRGITAKPVEIPPNRNDSVIRIEFDRKLVGALNMPVTIRAVLRKDRDRITAEAKLALRSGGPSVASRPERQSP